MILMSPVPRAIMSAVLSNPPIDAGISMSHSEKAYLGIDIGTGGVRGLAVTVDGRVLAQADAAIEAQPAQPDRHEQAPEAWWTAAVRVLRELGRTPGLAGIAVDGTSGTVLAIDADGTPLRLAMMYNDPRSVAEAEALNVAGAELCAKLGYRFAASYALAKIAWVRNNEPACFDRAARFIHQADYLAGKLTGDFTVTDYSNALKTGYDLVEECWPDFIGAHLGILDRLPRVVALGQPVGKVSREIAEMAGLPEELPVFAGASDGTAACIASGIRRPGDYNTTIGTTMVFKGISERLCQHPDGLVYCHKLPGGRWLPGAASNTGAEWTTQRFAGEDPSALSTASAAHLPTRHLAYPMMRKGERFPFLSASAEGFVTPEPAGTVEDFAAHLQGTAFVERWAYEVLDEVSGATGGEVFSMGGGSRSDVWMQCRADVTGRPVHRPACAESAFGSAVLAAAGGHYGDVWSAIESMVRVERSFTPDAAKRTTYDEYYAAFRAEMKNRGYA